MKIVIALIMLTHVAPTFAADCDCTTYPFKPNPPCYGECVGQLSTQNAAAIAKVKNLDPGVAVGIRVLGDTKTSVDFKAIRGKTDVEQAALKSLKERDVGTLK